MCGDLYHTPQYSTLLRLLSSASYPSMPFCRSSSASSLRSSKTLSGSTDRSSMPSISSSKPEAPLAGSITTKATARTSIGCARPPLTRNAAFFFACCSAKRSSSATHAASCSSADLLLGIIECDMVVALKVDRGTARRLCHLGCVDRVSWATIPSPCAIRWRANTSEPKCCT